MKGSALTASLDVPEYLRGFRVLGPCKGRKEGPHDPDLVIRIGRLLRAGASITEITRGTGVTRRFVSYWSLRLALPALRRKPRGCNKPKSIQTTQQVVDYSWHGYKGEAWTLRRQPLGLDPEWFVENFAAVTAALGNVASDLRKGRYS